MCYDKKGDFMKRKYDEVLEAMYALINRQKYDEHYRLPSENQLAETYGVSRYVVRTALNRLEREKYLVREQGRGTFVNSTYLREHPALRDDMNFRVAVILPLAFSYFIHQISAEIIRYYGGIGVACAHFYIQSQQEEDRLLRLLAEQQYDGILLYPINHAPPSEEIVKLIDKKFPIVLIDRYFKQFDVHTVSSNHFGSSHKLIDCLFQLGRRNICLVSEDPSVATTIQHRLSGFRQALSQKPLYARHCTEIFYRESERSTFLQKLYEHLQANPETDAIITNSGILATFTLNVLHKLHRKVGRDLDLALYDDEIYSFELLTRIPYIRILQDTATIGRTAAKVLHQLILRQPVPRQTASIPTVIEFVNFDKRRLPSASLAK